MAIAEPVEQVDIMLLKTEDGRVVFRVTPEGDFAFGPDFGTADAAKHFAEFVNKIMVQRDDHVLRENTELRKTILEHLKDKGELRGMVEEQGRSKIYDDGSGEPARHELHRRLAELHARIEQKCG